MGVFCANTFRAISSCLQHQHRAGRHNSSWRCKIEICFMRRKLTSIFPDRSPPYSSDTNPSLSRPRSGHRPVSLSLTQAAPRPSPNQLARSLLLPLLSGGTFLSSSWFSQVQALELEPGWMWQPVAPQGGGNPELQQEETRPGSTGQKSAARPGKEEEPGSRKHRPRDVRGAGSILETHPVCPRVSSLPLPFRRLAAPRAGPPRRAPSLILLLTHTPLYSRGVTHRGINLGILCCFKVTLHINLHDTARTLPHESLHTRLRAGDKTPPWVLCPLSKYLLLSAVPSTMLRATEAGGKRGSPQGAPKEQAEMNACPQFQTSPLSPSIPVKATLRLIVLLGREGREAGREGKTTERAARHRDQGTYSPGAAGRNKRHECHISWTSPPGHSASPRLRHPTHPHLNLPEGFPCWS